MTWACRATNSARSPASRNSGRSREATGWRGRWCESAWRSPRGRPAHPWPAGRLRSHVQLGLGRRVERATSVGKYSLVGVPQLGEEVQRAPQKYHLTADRPAAREAGNGLDSHGVEDGRREIRRGGALIEQGLEVGFREHSTPGRDRVQVSMRRGEIVQPGGVGAEQGRHLVDERPGTPGTGTVHPLLRGRLQVRDLGVFAAQLDDDVGGRVPPAYRLGPGDDFLGERQPKARRYPEPPVPVTLASTAASGNSRRPRRAGARAHPYVSVVSPVSLPQHVPIGTAGLGPRRPRRCSRRPRWPAARS